MAKKNNCLLIIVVAAIAAVVLYYALKSNKRSGSSSDWSDYENFQSASESMTDSGLYKRAGSAWNGCGPLTASFPSRCV